MLTLFAIPMMYYLSYVLSALAQDFRFMYPVTVQIQLVTLTALLARGDRFSRTDRV